MVLFWVLGALIAVPLLFLLYLLRPASADAVYPQRYTADTITDSYDYIVVGAGSAGCVVAARLAEHKRKDGSPAFRVLLVESGQECHAQQRTRNAAQRWFAHFLTDIDWDFCYPTQRNLNNRNIRVPRGHTTGGSSAINAQMWVRGAKEDFDYWESLGCTGWGWKDVLPAFNSIENYPEGDSEWRGHSGPVHVTKMPTVAEGEAACAAFVAAGILKPTPDYNAKQMGGIGVCQTNNYNGIRQDAFTTFIEPILDTHPNLQVVSRAFVRRVLFDDKKSATGIEVEFNGNRQDVRTIRADREVILSAGAISSPQTLMVSGVGHRDHLLSFGIPVVADVPVGDNFHDHLCCGMVLDMHRPVDNDISSGFPYTGFYQSDWAKRNTPGRGCDVQIAVAGGAVYAWAAPFILAQNFVPSPGAKNTFSGRFYRNLVKLFAPLCLKGGLLHEVAASALSLNVVVNQTVARGTVRLLSADPHVYPLLEPNGGAPEDMERVLDGLKKMRQVAAQSPLREMIKREKDPGPKAVSDEDLLAYIRKKAFIPWHPVGSCRMGVGKDAVVDLSLRVKGVNRLRVVDASIMPHVTSGNTNWPSMMIGARAAEIILQDL